MMKRRVLIVIIVTVLISTVVAIKANEKTFDNVNENVEALAGEEIDTELLKKMMMEEIWRVYLVYHSEIGVTGIACETGSNSICPDGEIHL